MSLQWLAVDLLTGKILCDLPGLDSKDPFRRTLGQYETSTATFTVSDTTDPEWERGLLEGGAACIAYTGQPGLETIVWGGIVTQAPRNLGNTIDLSLITVEGYLDRRYTGAYVATSRDQNLIVQDLVQQFAADTGGLPITVTIVGGAGAVRTVQYNDYDDKTVYSTLTALSALTGGPEWTMDWMWDHSTQLITPVLYVGNRIGSSPPAGLAPAVTFDETQMTDAKIPHDWSAKTGANIVTATGPGQGLARVQSTAVSTAFAGRPKYELRYAPDTSIFDSLTLANHAAETLAAVGNGNQQFQFAVQNNLPGFQLGLDWFIGDDLGFSVQSPTIPTPITGVSRCVGYEASDTTVKPLLVNPGV